MDIRTILIAGIVVFAAAGVVNSVWFGRQLKRYVLSTRMLSSDLDVFRFKKVVANQMRAALFQIVLLSMPIVVFISGIMFKALYPGDIFFVIIPSLVILAVAAYFRSWEMRARNVPVATPELLDQRDAIVRTWLRKALPDW